MWLSTWRPFCWQISMRYKAMPTKVLKQELLLIVNGAGKKYIKTVITTIKTNTTIALMNVKRKHNDS